MTNFSLFAAASLTAVSIVAACSDGSDAPSPSSSTSSSTSSSSSSGAPSSSSSSSSGSSGTLDQPVIGNKDGKPFFASKSGFFVKNPNGTIDLVLSDKDGACEDAKDKKVKPGVTLVQLYELGAKADGAAPAAVGPVVSNDVKYATVKDTCASGAVLGDAEVAASSPAKAGSRIDLTELTDAKVTGTLVIDTEDGGKLIGSFDVPSCPSSLDEGLTCR